MSTWGVTGICFLQEPEAYVNLLIFFQAAGKICLLQGKILQAFDLSSQVSLFQ
jgi:hypothetical protein